MREYETTFIVQPEISDEGGQAILTKLDGVLEAGGADRLMCEDHGKRKLAYEIRKFHKGHYYTLQFLNDGQVVPDLERTLRLEESVLRFLTILADEDVADVEGRKATAAEAEVEQEKRATERAQREVEEAAARRESEEKERQATADAAEAAAAAAATAATEAAATEPAAEAVGEAAAPAAPAAAAPVEPPAAAAPVEPPAAAAPVAEAAAVKAENEEK